MSLRGASEPKPRAKRRGRSNLNRRSFIEIATPSARNDRENGALTYAVNYNWKCKL